MTITENITINQNSGVENDENSRYLNNFLNASKNEPELIEYYDLEGVTAPPEIIYPDPDTLLNIKKKEKFKSELSNTKQFIDTVDSDSNEQLIGINREDGIGSVDNNAGSIIRSGVGATFDDPANYHHMLNGLDLKDQDLREHNMIDNIMYIYYGSSVTLRNGLGGSIIIMGTVIALAAQILAVIFAKLRNRLVMKLLTCGRFEINEINCAK